MNRTKMKRKRRDVCGSPLLDESPKRTKVQAQRKFAQGSNVNSPVITPIKELEIERPTIDVLPEPVELLPIKRPNTEDFLTFLCFRGTPILPQNLNFFNTASIVDTNGQVHKIKSESPKNGPIDSSVMGKCGNSSEKPFIAFGVRKRADPIVISRQMDRKRRHALAIQALRRKYQEQKMAKIRALTISKLSEKTTNRTLVKTNSVQKTETVTKKTNTIQKSQNIKVIATKHVKVTTRTLKTTLRPSIKQKMCLRSFRGRFVHRELPFRKKNVILERTSTKERKKQAGKSGKEEYETEEEAEKTPKTSRRPVKKPVSTRTTTRKTVVSSTPKVTSQNGSRMTRSGRMLNNKINARIQQIKKRILLNTPATLVKRRALRSTTMKKTVISQKRSRVLKTKQEQRSKGKDQRHVPKETPSPPKTDNTKKNTSISKKPPEIPKKDAKPENKKESKTVDSKKTDEPKLELKIVTRSLRSPVPVVNIKKTLPVKKLAKNVVESTDNKKEGAATKKEINEKKTDIPEQKEQKKEPEKKQDVSKKDALPKKASENKDDKLKKNTNLKKNPVKLVVKKEEAEIVEPIPIAIIEEKIKKEKETEKEPPIKKEKEVPKKAVTTKKETTQQKPPDTAVKKEIPVEEPEIKPTKPIKEVIDSKPKRDTVKRKSERIDETVNTTSQRPSRKTKEAAAIYMEILSHKLVNDSKKDDDTISIDSFPELPNVKKMEQRENELKAQASAPKDAESVDSEIIDVPDGKLKKTVVPAKKISKCEEEPTIDTTNNSTTSEEDKNAMISKIVEDEVQAVLGETKKTLKINKTPKEKCEPKPNPKINTKKRKPIVDLIENIETEEDTTKSKLRKTEEVIQEPDSEKRQTRYSMQNKSQVSDDSDESFHADVKVPRQKKLTRSKAPKRLPSPIDLDKEAKTNPKKSPVSSDSDQSTTSDVDLKTLKNRQKNKKFTKTKSMMKTDENFSDSDEEPLSKLTLKSVDGSQSSVMSKDKTKGKTDTKIEVKIKETKKVGPKKPCIEKVEKPIIVEEIKIKPKRECAKLPQNYLPMFSSSSDDEFHGFSTKTQEVCDKELPKMLEKTCAHLVPSSDLLSKGISRRFGKGKVNMSNEQIEKWLKDSAMAGSSIKKENDEMLKFGERIPTETSLDAPNSIDTEKLKTSLLPNEASEVKSDIKISDATSSNVTTPEKNVKCDVPSKLSIDRKLIFKKDKKEAAPNVNAFSPENESSVYAFGEETEPILSTIFRRPSRRPSSTATSRSEDESAKIEDTMKTGPFRKPPTKSELKYKDDVESSQTESEEHFNIPQNPSKPTKTQPTMVAKGKGLDKVFDKGSKTLDLLDDGKYKVPSSPSASSSSSAKLYKKAANKVKSRSVEVCNPIHIAEFPKGATPGLLVEAPVFHPSEQEFQDPIEYIERIRHKAEQFGICRIVPPSSFKPECKVQDDMRFTAYNQYVHKMLHRWGPNFKELMAIKKHLATQNITLTQPPWIGGMEIDLPRLYQTVQTLGGLKEVIEKKKWPKVSDLMKIPKSTQDRLTKLDDIYCKYLLPYDTLSPDEREKLFDDVETEWAKRESKAFLRAQQRIEDKPVNDSDGSDSDDFEAEECIVKGRTVALNAFYRIARNTMSMHFKNTEPSAQEVEQEFWKHVTMRQNHICVHSGSIDSGSWGYGFAVSKNSPFARHAWNLKVLTNNSGSVLRSMGPLMGVTVPTLHVGMVFSACCWYRDPHGLPWIEYLHTGGNKIWYGIPNSISDKFHMAVKKLMPNYCRNKSLWLISDTAMIPPSLLMENNVSLCRTVQEPGQFIVVFPKAFTSSISTGYVVSESVYFATQNWLKTARSIFDELRISCEPSMFSLDRLLLSIATDSRTTVEVLRQIIPHIKELCDKEKDSRIKLQKFAIKENEKMPLPEAPNARKRKKLQGEEGDYECETCRMNLFVSMVFDTYGNATYCLDHSVDLLESKKIDPQKCKFMFTYDDEEIDQISHKINVTIESKLQKKIPNKFAGMPTLLK